MIRVVVNKEGEIFADVTGNKAVAHMFLKMLLWLKKHNKRNFRKYFKASKEQLDPVYKEIIRLIYREEIPK